MVDKIKALLKEDAKGKDQMTDPNALKKIQKRTKPKPIPIEAEPQWMIDGRKYAEELARKRMMTNG